MRLRIYFFILFACLHQAPILAQTTGLAMRYFKMATYLESAKEHTKAREYMEKAIAISPTYREAYSILGLWYFQDRKYEDAIRIFSAAKAAFPQNATEFDYPLARSLVYAGRVEEALPLMQHGTEAWKKLQQQALFYQQAIQRAWQDTLIPVRRVNTNMPEFFPWITGDDSKLFFTRRIGKTDEDLLVAQRDSCGDWFTGYNLGLPFNSPHQETALSFSADGHYLFFTKCDNRSPNGWGHGGCDLYMSYTADDSVWSVPQEFGATINTPGFEGMPCLSPDNRELYFVSNRPGGYGGLDIWVAKFENGLWQLPRNLGPTINTLGDETAPFLHPDNRSLYFASNGHPGMGGNDLFVSRKIRDTIWSQPVNLGYPINSTADENSMSITPDGQKMFFASDRGKVAGDFDIYEYPTPLPLQPEKIMSVHGYSYDSISGDRLNFASIYITDQATGAQLYHFVSNRGDGSYMFTLSPGKVYSWKAYRVGYQHMEGVIDLRDDSAGNVKLYPIAMLPQDYVAPVNDSLIHTIRFSLNSTKLTKEDKDSLWMALQPWIYEPAVLWYVNGYTDNTGTPMLNEQLSYTRAGLVVEELVNLGVDPMYIHTRGWGEAEPVADNDTEEGRNANRRVEIVIRR
jgi:hypothetical protein